MVGSAKTSTNSFVVLGIIYNGFDGFSSYDTFSGDELLRASLHFDVWVIFIVLRYYIRALHFCMRPSWAECKKAGRVFLYAFLCRNSRIGECMIQIYICRNSYGRSACILRVPDEKMKKS